MTMAGRTILVMMPHADDAELSCDGTVARWVREGDRAILLVATDGARGAKHSNEPDRMRGERHAEQLAAAEVVGYEDVRFLGFADGELENDAELRGVLVREIRSVRPDVVILIDPLTVIHRNSYVNHRDHRMLGMAALDALYPASSNAGYFSEHLGDGMQLHKVPEVLLAVTDSPNYWVDVTETMDIRFQALRKHASQVKLWPDEGEGVIQQQREHAAVLGVEHGMGYAEEFRRIVVNPLT
jgi:LmbE family N-acetylglucosaminyl deacetylase